MGLFLHIIIYLLVGLCNPFKMAKSVSPILAVNAEPDSILIKSGGLFFFFNSVNPRGGVVGPEKFHEYCGQIFIELFVVLAPKCANRGTNLFGVVVAENLIRLVLVNLKLYKSVPLNSVSSGGAKRSIFIIQIYIISSNTAS